MKCFCKLFFLTGCLVSKTKFIWNNLELSWCKVYHVEYPHFFYHVLGYLKLLIVNSLFDWCSFNLQIIILRSGMCGEQSHVVVSLCSHHSFWSASVQCSIFSFCRKQQKHFVLFAYVLICLIMTKVHSEFFKECITGALRTYLFSPVKN